MKILFTVFLNLLTCVLHAQTKSNSDSLISSYFEYPTEKLNPIEGYWTISTTQEIYKHDTLIDVIRASENSFVGIIKQGALYKTIYRSGELYEVEFTQTDVNGVYLFRNYFSLNDEHSKLQAVICKGTEMEYTYDLPENYVLAKMKENFRSGLRIVNILKWKKTPGPN